MDKKKALLELEAKMRGDSSLPLRESALVFGEGNPDCAVMFIGEAPGATEDRLGRPFVGRAGKLLASALEGMGWERANVYITNIVKRRPPGNRDPLPAEIAAFKVYLDRQIDIIDPRAVVTLGRFAMNYFLPEAKISNDHGTAFRVGGRIVFPVYHPAAALRSTKMLGIFRDDLGGLPEVLSRL